MVSGLRRDFFPCVFLECHLGTKQVSSRQNTEENVQFLSWSPNKGSSKRTESRGASETRHHRPASEFITCISSTFRRPAPQSSISCSVHSNPISAFLHELFPVYKLSLLSSHKWRCHGHPRFIPSHPRVFFLSSFFGRVVYAPLFFKGYYLFIFKLAYKV